MISPEIVRKVADLAKLELTESELQEFSGQLSQILTHFEDLSRVNTAGVDPLITPTEISPRQREDLVTKSFGAEGSLANAPERAGNLFRVPPVVG